VKGRSSWLPLMASASMEAVTAALKLPLRTDGAGASVSWQQGHAGPIGGSRSAAEALLGSGPGRGMAASRLGAVRGAQGRGLAPWALLGRRVPGATGVARPVFAGVLGTRVHVGAWSARDRLLKLWRRVAGWRTRQGAAWRGSLRGRRENGREEGERSLAVAGCHGAGAR
jgi:hypothetical protein